MISLPRRRIRILLACSGIIVLLVRISSWCIKDSVDNEPFDGTSQRDNRGAYMTVTEQKTTGQHPLRHTTVQTRFKNQAQKQLGLLHDNKMEERFAQRRLVADLACSRTWLPDNRQCRRNALKTHLHLVGSYNSTLCAIEKAGSTFLKRIIKVISTPKEQRKASNPFDYDRGIIYNSERTLREFSDDDVRDRMKHTKNIIFVRDPYTRVFSFYLDKLYNTNTCFWFNFGTKIVRKERTNPGNTSLACGHDVTFQEFLSYLVKMVNNLDFKCPLDGHLSSNYDHCYPCHFNYTYIGKYETLHEDLYHILSREGMDRHLNFTAWHELNDYDSFDDGAKFVFLDREKIEKCMSIVSGLRRLWRQQQSRSMLDKRARFPFTEKDNTSVTKKTYLEALMKAYRKFDPKDRLHNRQEALSEAYKNVDTSLVRQFSKAFRLDFEIFGYNSSPPTVATCDFKYLVFE